MRFLDLFNLLIGSFIVLAASQSAECGGGCCCFNEGPMYYESAFLSSSDCQPSQAARVYNQPRNAPPVYSQMQRALPAYNQVQNAPPIYNQPSYGPRPATARPTTIINIGVYDDSFEPKTINVQLGTTVKWVNYGKHIHTVTSSGRQWDSGDIPPGAFYSATFLKAGTYNYYCLHHNRMEGTLIVGGAESGPTRTASQARSP
jgi:plastocyanin